MTGNDPVWHCPSCRRQFGHPEEPSEELSKRTPDDWVRAPAHRERRFQRIVNADSGIVNTDSSAS